MEGVARWYLVMNLSESDGLAHRDEWYMLESLSSSRVYARDFLLHFGYLDVRHSLLSLPSPHPIPSQSRGPVGTHTISQKTLPGRNLKRRETCPTVSWTCPMKWLERNGRIHTSVHRHQQAAHGKELYEASCRANSDNTQLGPNSTLTHSHPKTS
jgi:hypothetical protein